MFMIYNVIIRLVVTSSNKGHRIHRSLFNLSYDYFSSKSILLHQIFKIIFTIGFVNIINKKVERNFTRTPNIKKPEHTGLHDTMFCIQINLYYIYQ